MRYRLSQLPGFLLPPIVLRPLTALYRLGQSSIARTRVGSLRKLHLACGRNVMPGWANLDIEGPWSVIKHDLTRRLPVASESMDVVYSEHFIEHIEKRHAEALVRDCCRVLRPGGVLRVSTPDLRRLVDEYLAGRLDYWHDMNWKPASPADLLNEGLGLWGHQFVFDTAELEALLKRAGFSRVERRGWRESPHPEVANLECRPFHGELIYDCIK